LAALHALMMMDPDKAMPVLRKILADSDDRDPEMKRHALMVLTMAEDEDAERIFLEFVRQETDTELLAQSIFHLSNIGSAAALDAVVDAYHRTDDPEVKRVALMSLGEAGDERAEAILLEVVRDSAAHTELRAQAVIALSRSGADGLADLFTDLYLESDDPEFKTVLMLSMSQIDEPAPTTWFIGIINDHGEDVEVRQQALHQAGMMGLIDVDFMRTVYEADDDPEMRTQICFALAQLDDPDAVDLIIEIVRNETHPEVRQNAVFWLGQFDDPRVADFLVELIEAE